MIDTCVPSLAQSQFSEPGRAITAALLGGSSVHVGRSQEYANLVDSGFYLWSEMFDPIYVLRRVETHYEWVLDEVRLSDSTH
jgi:hypothetical protein